MEYLFTERAHLACPNMCFAIAASLGKFFDKERIEETVTRLTEAHPFLRARLGYEKETNSYFYDVKEQRQVQVIFAGKFVMSTKKLLNQKIAEELLQLKKISLL